jgi:peptidoglycan/LPS O-acetylase OafA/YrhL
MISPHTGIRGLAAMVVFLMHLCTEPQITLGMNQAYFSMFYWGEYAVDLFFILSGFILHWVYFGKQDHNINWGGYLKARCVRILPLYYLTLAAFLPPCIRTLRFYGAFHEHGKHLALLLGNLSLLSGFSGEPHWSWTLNGPSWSISIEFFAYLVLFPLLVMLFTKYREAALFPTLVISILGMMLCYATMSHSLMGWEWTRFSRGLFGFPLGFALCMLFKHTEVKSSTAVDAVCFTAVVIMILSLYSILPRILILCVLPFLVYFTAFDKGRFCGFLNAKLNQWLGERSYSIYLWHTPIMYVYFIPKVGVIDSFIRMPRLYQGAVNMMLIIVSVLIVSELSYRYFESPIRQFFRTKSSRSASLEISQSR